MRKVKPGGTLIFDHYQFTYRYYFELLNCLDFLQRMENKKSIELCKRLVDLFFPMYWLIRGNTTLKRIFKKIIPLGIDTSSTRNSLDYDSLKEWTYLDTHDALADPIKILISKKKML